MEDGGQVAEKIKHLIGAFTSSTDKARYSETILELISLVYDKESRSPDDRTSDRKTNEIGPEPNKKILEGAYVFM